MVSRNEIHVFLRGGLGNQLYQYALAKDLSLQFSKKLVIREDLLPLERDVIAGITRWPNQLVEFKHAGRIFYSQHQPAGKTNLFGKFMQLMRILGDFAPNLAVSFGWLSSENSKELPKADLSRLRVINSYSVDKEVIARNRDALLRELENLVNPSKPFLELMGLLIESPKTIVHVRKGDYVNLGNIYGVITIDYYLKALELLTKRSTLYPIWIFTDSPSGLSTEEITTLRPERIVGPADIQSPLENLLLMSKGASLIASNSTYSWWASQLSDKKSAVVAPLLRHAKINNFDQKNEPRDTIMILTVE